MARHVLLDRVGLQLPAESPARMADVGRVMAFRGRASEAVSRLERAMGLSPQDERLPRWLQSMAYAQFALGDYAGAVRWAQRTLEHELSTHAEAFTHLLLAASYAHLGRGDQARQSVSEALLLWPGLEIERDLVPHFMGGDKEMQSRYIYGLHRAGLES